MNDEVYFHRRMWISFHSQLILQAFREKNGERQGEKEKDRKEEFVGKEGRRGYFERKVRGKL